MTDFQSVASTQGRSFEETVATMLRIAGWNVIETHTMVAGFEIDIIADDLNDVRWWIECKGSWRGNVPGARRGDTVKKAVGVAWYLSRQPDRRPYMLVASHLPKPGTNSKAMLDEALRAGLFNQINTVGFLGTPEMEEDE